jgi:hypothetical protein
LASLVYKNTLNQILYWLGVTHFLYRVETASLVLPLQATHTAAGIIIGLFADLVLLSWVALVIALILRYTGYDYYLFKGIFVGASSWLICYGFLAHNTIINVTQPTDVTSALVTIFFDLTIGLVSALVIVRLDAAPVLPGFSNPNKD